MFFGNLDRETHHYMGKGGGESGLPPSVLPTPPSPSTAWLQVSQVRAPSIMKAKNTCSDYAIDTGAYKENKRNKTWSTLSPHNQPPKYGDKKQGILAAATPSAMIYPGPRGFLSPRREYQATDKEAARENLWLPAMRISLSCYDSCQSTSRDWLTSNQ